ncbi:hypothetical protein EYZ11_000181 [Aspergillus tanneri]|uniref:Uncharacterized protein n=1 Tax=Aspergillus tanneri TaxID=1220188 RepID=A0A4S3JXU4_9EURO|nr:hypothetical protein EYZ11_000181 [Aspergillus tanneri]
MPNVSVAGGWWNFENYGPVTTTFTQPTSCSAIDNLQLGYVTDSLARIEYAVQCTKEFDSGCLPTATVTATASRDYDMWVGYGGYYSPGLYCPSGWATVGLAARDGNKSLSKSGILTTSTSERYPSFDDPATLLARILEPSQTMALCCPSTMTPDNLGGCYSLVPDYKPTVGCYVYEHDEYQYETSTKLYTYGSSTRTHVWETPTATDSILTTYTETLYGIDQSLLTAISYMPMVTLVHHQSDLQSVGTGTGTAESTATGSTGRLLGMDWVLFLGFLLLQWLWGLLLFSHGRPPIWVINPVLAHMG